MEFASTWCAVAAVVSVLVLGWVRRPETVPRPHDDRKLPRRM
ncbi:DUF6629 family protein [Streptomyces sp. 147326]